MNAVYGTPAVLVQRKPRILHGVSPAFLLRHIPGSAVRRAAAAQRLLPGRALWRAFFCPSPAAGLQTLYMCVALLSSSVGFLPMRGFSPSPPHTPLWRLISPLPTWYATRRTFSVRGARDVLRYPFGVLCGAVLVGVGHLSRGLPYAGGLAWHCGLRGAVPYFGGSTLLPGRSATPFATHCPPCCNLFGVGHAPATLSLRCAACSGFSRRCCACDEPAG